MARRATQIKNTRAQAQSFLLLDAGNSLIGEGSSVNDPASRTRGQTSVEILNRTGYDAVALGDKDLALGKADLQKRLTEAKSFTFVSANLKDKATGKLIAQPYVIKQIGGHRVALIGITHELAGESADFTVTPPLDAARATVQQVEAQADVIILLSNADAEANKAIGSAVQGIDLIFSGGSEVLDQPVEAAPGTLVMQADQSSPGHAGRALGILQAEFDRSGKLTQHTWSDIKLDKSIADDPAMAAWVAEITKQ